MNQTKDPRQIWFGVEPGSLVNLDEKVVYRAADFAADHAPSIIQQQLEN